MYAILLSCRYTIADMDAKTLIGDRKIETPAEKKEVKQDIGKVMKQKFLSAPEDSKVARDTVFLRKKLRF